MTGTELFKHAYGMIERNFGVAMRISLVLFVLSLAFQAAITFWTVFNPQLSYRLGTVPFLVISYLPGLVTMVLGAWVAVAWHRYVLLEEDPGGWIPNFNGREILGYILWLLLMMVIYFAILLPFIAVAALAATGLEGGGTAGAGLIIVFVISGFATIIAAVIVLTRLSTCLVSRAVSQRLSLAQAWNATRGSSWPIVVYLLLMFAVMLVVGIIVSLLMAVVGVAAFVIVVPAYLLLTWFLMIFQVSIMTTLYGYYIEGRELVA
ncbi:hypothetical protein SAMN04488030_2905 [Aliiroseovarius halocynthiae]|uniref:Glycerophosphoryl diester phosphodiesterase membrane domain-containing protein n=1 Tax=Aliiroseovarius halocynthiae TaxID=985055 RepID=A0A545SNL2_9RHOB|nr:hypothetical protein [Aliiroseovarius halocynthiae]TQV66578.1 hypothetical protein FIL88_12685 [Aliiroseovarius halocynthiae]SMR82552.1 hypothetical protein SAMN04488030_2905 [Aliiroseovarius halocynthiae]